MPAASSLPFELTHNTEVRHRCTLTFYGDNRPRIDLPGNSRVVVEEIVFGKVGSGRQCLLDLVSWTGHSVFADDREALNYRTGASNVADFPTHIQEAHREWRRRRALLSDHVTARAAELIAQAKIIGGGPDEG